MNDKNGAWPTWQQAMQNGTLPHEYAEKLKRTADSIQANRLDYMPRTFALDFTRFNVFTSIFRFHDIK